MTDPNVPHHGSGATTQERVVAALRTARLRLEELEARQSGPTAIVGMACRFPGDIANVDAFWRFLLRRGDAISEPPPDRARYLGATRWAAWLRDVEMFDSQFFGIAPREAACMDPQQRILVETSWEALEHAGIAPDTLAGGRTGVFVGLSSHDYEEHLRHASDRQEVGMYGITGNGACFAAGRVAYLFGLQGPTLSLDTACSSSLVSLHLAHRSLRNGECDVALAGGVNLILSELTTWQLEQSNALSPDGRCKTFDASANGYVRGEGCGMLVLKRLADAQRDGDRIWAVVRGSAVNHDGRSTGLTTPNVLSQQALLRAALEDARLGHEDITYVETHGTGTPLGDPIEFEALRAVYGQPGRSERRCLLGAVKTNVGHLEAASGVAGVIKAVLALQHGLVPGNLHLRVLNPRIELHDTPFVLPTDSTPWPDAPNRFVGVSSFGLSGTNAHVILGEAPPAPPPFEHAPGPHVLVVSAHTQGALREQTQRWIEFLEADPTISLQDVCYTAATGRRHLPHRLCVVAMDRDELLAALRRELAE